MHDVSAYKYIVVFAASATMKFQTAIDFIFVCDYSYFGLWTCFVPARIHIFYVSISLFGVLHVEKSCQNFQMAQ